MMTVRPTPACPEANYGAASVPTTLCNKVGVGVRQKALSSDAALV